MMDIDVDGGILIRMDGLPVGRLGEVLENYYVTIMDRAGGDIPAVVCNLKHSGGFQWYHIFEDFYDNPKELTLGRLLEVAAKHEMEAHHK